VVNSLRRNLIVTAAHCEVPRGFQSQLWFAPDFNATAPSKLCPLPVTPGAFDLTKCPASDTPYGVWKGGNVVPNPVFGGLGGVSGSNDQMFIQLSGADAAGDGHYRAGICDVPRSQCPSPNQQGNPDTLSIESATPAGGGSALGGDPMDFFYSELGGPILQMPPPGTPKGITFTTFGYPIDVSSTHLTDPCKGPADNQFSRIPNAPTPGYGWNSVVNNVKNSCTYGVPLSSGSPVGASGSPWLTNASSAPLDGAIAAVHQGFDLNGGDTDAFAGVPGLFTALTYLKADVTSQ